MSKLNVVAIPFHDWKKSQAEGFRTRDAHLLQEFRKHPLVNRLLIVDRPISIAEMLFYRRPWRIQGKQRLYHQGRSCVTQVDEKTFVLDILVGQFFRPTIQRRKWVPYIFGKDLVRRSVDNAINALEMDEYALFLSSPLSIPLYQQLSPKLLAVDAVDDLTKHASFRDMQDEISKFYKVIRGKAEVIFANSAEISAWLSENRDSVIHVPNGVDFYRFRNATVELPIDLYKLNRPIVGYAGKMQEMFDIDLLRSVAYALPEISFVCIGQILDPQWMKPLWDCPNVYYLGDKHYEELPNYLHNFDVCIIPYSADRQHGGDPIKFYEYLAADKPVVTTDIGNVSAYKHLPHVNLVKNSGEFIEALERIIKVLKDGKGLPKARLPEDVLWSTKADRMIGEMVSKLDKL